jgi:hypothetical protein
LEKLSGGGVTYSPKWQQRWFALGDGKLMWGKNATKISRCGDAWISLCASLP